jgi:Fur family ferric uptake transcriptional regulator
MVSQQFQRNTQQRQVILEELRKVTSHPTVAELHTMVRSRLPKISLGTVYRNLDLMAQMGIIQKLETTGAEARFDGNADRHDHLRCVQCGKVEDIGQGPLGRSAARGRDFRGYRILGHRLEFVGLCPRCQKRSKHTQTPNP